VGGWILKVAVVAGIVVVNYRAILSANTKLTHFDTLIVLGTPCTTEGEQAQDTIQNIWFSKAIMDAHGWRSAEVVSSPSHLPRTALILEHYTGKDAFVWKTHPSQWPTEFTREQIVQHYAGEMKGCWRLTHQGFPKNRWLPGG
jgi:DUF218 domain